MKALVKRVAALFFPHRCYICDRVLPYPETVCENCEKRLLRYGEMRGAKCDICGLPHKSCICGPARFYKKAVFPLYYQGDVRSALHKLKFRGRLDKVPPFANAMIAALTERDVLDKTDLITFIPMTDKHLKKRGYNQAEALCKAISEKTGVEMLSLLEKQEDVGVQHDLRTSSRRRGNVIGTFEPNKDLLNRIRGSRILVTDDILTSGATLNEAAKTLLIFGAEDVYACAAAATPKRKNKEKKKE